MARHTYCAAKACLIMVPTTNKHLNHAWLAVLLLQDLAGSPGASLPDPSDLSAPALTTQQLEPALQLPDDRGSFSASGKYPSVDSLQAHPVQTPRSHETSHWPPFVSMAIMPAPAPQVAGPHSRKSL